jgi:hypothetical protein
MSTLIVAGLMAFGLLAIITAVFLAMDESKTFSTNPAASATTKAITATTPRPITVPAHVAARCLPAIREEAQVSAITTQFSELTAQLRALHEQARDVERRLSMLSDIAAQIELGQAKVSIEETQGYRLPEPADSARA